MVRKSPRRIAGGRAGRPHRARRARRGRRRRRAARARSRRRDPPAPGSGSSGARAARPDAADRCPHRGRLAPRADRDVHRAAPRRRGRQRARLARAGEPVDHDHHSSRRSRRPTRSSRPGHAVHHRRRPVPSCSSHRSRVERLDPSPRRTAPPRCRAPPPAVAPSPPASSVTVVRRAARRLPLVDRGRTPRPRAQTRRRSTPVGARSTRTNRAAIGDNPNLIHIGLTLELPPLVAQP